MYNRFNYSSDELGGGNHTRMYSSANFTLPYWLGRYHGMIAPEATTDGPTSINLSLPENAEMVVDESRSIGFVILPETNFHRSVTWSSSDDAVATVDKWGRVTAHKAGTVSITARSEYNPNISDTVSIKIVASEDELAQSTPSGIVNFNGTPAEEVQNLQKYVDRYTKDEALASEDVPQTVKDALSNGTGSTAAVTQGDVTWSLEVYGIKRLETEPVHERDGEQYFMGDRYLPADAKDTPNTSIIHMESDNANGLWVASASAVTHIRMEELSYTDKAAEMSATSQEVSRYGFVSGTRRDDANSPWEADDDDNDGLWTSMYGVGELMRYAVLREDGSGATDDEVQTARDAALRSLKAVLLLSNVSCRQGTVDAFVRPLRNGSNWYLNKALLKGGDPSVRNLQHSPADTTVRNDDESLMAPVVEEDWADLTLENFTGPKDAFETRTRSLEGFVARTLTVGDENYGGGNRWKINEDGTATCVMQDTTDGLPKYDSSTVDASDEIPEILLSVLPEGTVKSDITYKADTSTDELIGHLFIYKVAYDILDESNPEEAQLKALVSDTMDRLAQHFVDNGYSLRDATGQGTSWGKTELDYFNNGMTWEDSPLNCLVLLNIFKVASYVTGEQRWEDEYRMLATEEPYRYADLCGTYWERLLYVAQTDGVLQPGETPDHWALNYLNYSDEEMAMLAYYLLFQLEDDSVLLDKYRVGLNDWWNSMQYSENPLWYYIYQLAYPDEVKTDYFGNSLIETASWTLSRHPIDTIKWTASHPERPDVTGPVSSFLPDEELANGPTLDKETGEIRVAPFDERAVHKYNGNTYKLYDDNSNAMETSTTYTLPYWLGRYHGMIAPEATTDGPTSINLSLPENAEMVVDESRSIGFTILPESNLHRGVAWSSSDEEIATVDEWGRVTAHKAGTVTITATSTYNPAVSDTAAIKVVNTTDELSKSTPHEIVNYEGTAAEEVHNLQKYVDRYTKDEALASEDVPQTVKDALNNGTGSTSDVTQDDVTWSLEIYGIKRVETEPVHERDAEQYFMGNRYLPDDAKDTPNTSIIHMEGDTAGTGLWVVSAGAVTHIRMEELSYTDKAADMSATTQEYVARRGMVSEAVWNGEKWVPQETDNDGLWTSMYGAGELMRYKVLQDEGVQGAELEAAKKAALDSIKATLLLSNITCRTGTVEAYVRPLMNSTNQCHYTEQGKGLALLKDKEYAVYDRQGSPADTQVRNDDPNFLTPIVPEDWAIVDENSDKSLFATRTRSLDGMIARTYRLEGEYPDANFNDGYYWNIDGQIAKCEETTSTKVKWENLAGTTVDASGEIPEVLADLLGDATKDDIIYKTDTSTDEIIGHLFIYKIAYDILGDEGEEGQLKELISDTMRRIAQHFADNGYSLLDATGQGTTWGKTNLDYFNNGMTWEDNSLNCLVVLNIFKLAAYVTGEQRWEDEYQMLATEEPFRYADLCGKYWEHLAYVAHKNGFVPEDASEEEVNNWILNYLNYSDEEMAMLAYYLLFQMEDDSILLDKYREGLNDWWNSIQHSENPLWYYIYQLAYPSESKTDYYGNSLVETASWTLSRHPIDTIKWSATHPERPDVKAPDPTQYQGSPDDEIEFLNRGPTRDKTTGEIRVAPFDERGLHKYNGSTYGLEDINPNQMEGSTTYTLPYWLGRYHGMITPEATTDGPTSINLSLPENTEMVVGDNRSIDFTILPESNPYRGVTWTSDNEEVATVDKWGRVTAHKAGTVTITAAAKANPQVTASGTIKVVASLDELSKTGQKDIVNYEGTPAEEVHNLQKYVDRYTKEEVLPSEEVPQTVKNALTDGSGASTAAVTQGDVIWSLETYGIKRLETEPVHERDAEQYFMGNRYLPDEAKETPDTSIIHMESDTADTGLWVVSANAVTHIRMEELSYTEKATEMSNNTHTYLDRYGFISESLYKDGKWVPQDNDNEGTWTGKYSVGELMRYAVLKREGASAEEIAVAREYALRSLKATLLLANVSCRTGTVEAFVRPLKNGSNWYLNKALLKGGDPSTHNLQHSPADTTVRNDDETFMTPVVEEDWADLTLENFTGPKDAFETRTRSLAGFVCRTIYLKDREYFEGGNRWQINDDGTATCICQDTVDGLPVYDSTTVDASGEIPEILMTVLPEGTTKSDIVYKADTSTDEIINHLLLYKVAYDILDEEDPEEAEIKAVLVDTVRAIAQHFVDNGYALRDATGQGTSWGKTELDYFNNGMTWEDCSLNSLVLLNVFKLAGYVTGEARWENEYRMLATEEPYRYADLCGKYWERLEYVAHADGGLPEDASQEEVDEWIRYYLCYPDEEMAVSAYYLLFQMEEDEALLEKYRAGFDDWWKSMQYSENPMYYYMYQLSFPNEEQTDAYGRSIVESASWELSREPIDTIAWSAHHEDRPDVYADDGGYGWEAISRDRETNEIRVVPADERGIHKFDNSTYNLNHKNNPQLMEGCTNFTMPYWIGRYHGPITPDTTETEEPIISLAVMSDIHVGCTDHVMPTTHAERFETALNFYTENGFNYDAVILNGDCADNPSVSDTQFDTFMEVLNANIQEGAQPIINTGNHENYLGNQIQEVFYEKTGIGSNPAYTISENDDSTESNMIFYDTWVNGYHFIVFNHDRKDLSDERISWLTSKIEEGYNGQPVDPSKPVFLVSHYDQDTWADRSASTVEKLQPVFEAHPNVVMFTGHNHASLNNIHNLLGNRVGCLSIHDGGVGDVQTEGDYYTAKPISQGLFVEVYANYMLVHQLAFNDGGYEMAEPVRIPLDDMLSVVPTDDEIPTFSEDAAVAVDDITFNSCSISFPAASDNHVVSHYNIFVRSGDGEEAQVDLIYNPYWLKNETADFTRTLKGLTPGSTGNVVLVEAYDAWGNLSARIESAPFDVPAADPSYSDDAPTVLRMDFSTVEGNTVKDASVNQNDALLEGNASVVYDETFKKNVLVLDGTGARGDANSSCARIPFNSSLYTQDAITIETAFIIDEEISDDTSALHGSDEQHIISNYETGGYSLAYGNGDGKLHFYMDSDFNELSADITRSQPHHVMVTYDHATLKLFVDGVLCDETSANSDIAINVLNDLFLGADSEGFQDRYQFFKGRISFVNIFDRGLSDEEVQSSYDAFAASLA